jgi:Ni/Co efflux regulator RcnB
MKKLALFVFASSLSLSHVAFAQYHDDRDDHGRDFHEQHGEPEHGHMHGDHHHEGRGAGPRHDLYKGMNLPPEFRTHQHVVDSWHHHHLSAPPRGYHWVQVGADYVLVSIRTGKIAQVVIAP